MSSLHEWQTLSAAELILTVSNTKMIVLHDEARGKDGNWSLTRKAAVGTEDADQDSQATHNPPAVY